MSENERPYALIQDWKTDHRNRSHYSLAHFLQFSKALFIWRKVGPGKTWAGGYDKLPPSMDWNISVRMLCMTRLGSAKRVDSLEIVYMRKSWLAPPGHPILPTEWPYSKGHPPPRARFVVSHVNGRRWFISNCRKTWLAPVGSGPQANFTCAAYSAVSFSVATAGLKNFVIRLGHNHSLRTHNYSQKTLSPIRWRF